MDLDSALPTPTLIQVHVNTTLHIPFHSHVLQPLDEAGAGTEVKEEILKEAIRLTVSEKLGYFDQMDIRYKGVEVPKAQGTGARAVVVGERKAPAKSEAVYEVALNLTALGKCVEAIQEAYNHIQQQALLLREVASCAPPEEHKEEEGEEVDSGEDKKMNLLALLDVVASRDERISERERAEALKVLRETLVAVGDITERMCVLPSRITEAAAAATAGAAASADAHTGGEEGQEDTAADHIPEHEREKRERREAKKRLLAEESDDGEKDPNAEEKREGDGEAAGAYGPVDNKEYLYDDSDDDDDEAHYAKMGYTQL